MNIEPAIKNALLFSSGENLEWKDSVDSLWTFDGQVVWRDKSLILLREAYDERGHLVLSYAPELKSCYKCHKRHFLTD